MRVTLIVLVFFGGAGLIVYVACWLLVPLEGSDRATVRLDDRSRTFALGLVGVIAALALLGDSLGGWRFPWPLFLAGVVVLLVMLSRGRREAADVQPVSAPAASTYEPLPYAPPAPAPPRAPKRRGPLLFWYSLALIAIGVGLLGTFDLAGAAVAPSAYPALALTTCAVMLVIGAFWGRPGGLILLGLVSAAATAGVLLLGELTIDRITDTPVTSAELRSDYALDIGEIDLDLNDLGDLDSLDGRRVDLEVGLGRIEVLVPDGLDVTVHSDLGAGDSTVFGSTSDGGVETVSYDGGSAVPTLTLYVTVGLGEIEIARDGGR